MEEVKEEKKGWRRRMSKTRRSSRQRGCRGRKGMNEKRCEEGERKYTSGCSALLPHLLLLHPLLLLLLLEREWLSGCDEKIMRQIRPVSYLHTAVSNYISSHGSRVVSYYLHTAAELGTT